MDDYVQHIYDKFKELFAIENWTGVIELSRKALQSDPENINYLSNLANALDQSSFPGEAISTWREVLRLNPQNAEAYRRIGMIFDMQERYAEAIEAFRQSIALDPTNGDTLFRLARIIGNNGYYREALDIYEQALQAGEDTPLTYYGKGFCLERINNFQLAADMYSISVQKAPFDARAQNALGNVLAKLGKKEQAIAAWKRVIELDNSEFVARAKASLEKI